jgi:hypothetical protein
MLLKAIDTLGNLPHKVVTSAGSWYLVRKHMLTVEPETEIPEPSASARVQISARISDEAHGLLRDFCTVSCAGNFSAALDAAILGFFKVKKVKKTTTPCLSATPTQSP